MLSASFVFFFFKQKTAYEMEYKHFMNYIPYFSGTVGALLDTGETGQLFLECVAKYYENFITAREKGRHTAVTTFCFSPAILYAMDVYPICFEIVSVCQTFAYKRGSAEFLDY